MQPDLRPRAVAERRHLRHQPIDQIAADVQLRPAGAIEARHVDVRLRPSKRMMLVFSPLKPRRATSAPARSTSSSERIGSKPVHSLMRLAWLIRHVPQCDQ